MVDHLIILAGGAGTRLWPASTKKHPKQYLSLKEGKSLLRLTLERAGALGLRGNIFIVTLKDQLKAVISECENIEDIKNRICVLPEPCGRNTAPAITAVSVYLESMGMGNDTVLVMPADHLITPLETFKKDVDTAGVLAKDDFIVTFAIPPAYPETGYGYIEAGKIHEPGFLVKSFREKPDIKTAETFFKEGNYFWNSGMFSFKIDTFLSDLSLHAPDVYRVFKKIGNMGKTRDLNGIKIIMEGKTIEDTYKTSPSISIDYAVMEKSSRAAMIKTRFSWNDIGSWDEFAKISENSGEVFSSESGNNFVFSDLPVALSGVDDLIVVVKNGSVLICKEGASQGVKEIVSQIKEAGMNNLL